MRDFRIILAAAVAIILAGCGQEDQTQPETFQTGFADQAVTESMFGRRAAQAEAVEDEAEDEAEPVTTAFYDRAVTESMFGRRAARDEARQ